MVKALGLSDRRAIRAFDLALPAQRPPIVGVSNVHRYPGPIMLVTSTISGSIAPLRQRQAKLVDGARPELGICSIQA